MAVRPLDLWKNWATEILVLLSFSLQVVLLHLAGIRRREPPAVAKFILWLAYQLADSTAIYTIGHLFFTSGADQNQIVAFWAPFLLLHLGGPDNITAYALQDNELWQRHLQTLIVQVLGAAYVLYNHIAGGSFFVLLAAILMFGVGVVKYAEKTWALRCGNLNHIRSSLRNPFPKHHQFHTQDIEFDEEAGRGDEYYVRRAHSLFHVCKHAIVDSWIRKDKDNEPTVEALINLKEEEDCKAMWTLMEMELSLMYDLLYTKAGVIHTWQGYCIRIISPLAVAASLLLFQFSGNDSERILDVIVTYTLLIGALILETGSLFRALGSTWTYAYLCTTKWSWLQYAVLCTGRWDRLRRFIKAATCRSERNISERRWSGKMGQYNLLHYCSRHDRAYTPLLGRLAKVVGYKEWWIRYHYSSTIDIPDDLKQRLFNYVRGDKGKESPDRKEHRPLNAQGLIRENWGQKALEYHSKTMASEHASENLYEEFKKPPNLLGVEFQECIIVWHIGTDVFLTKSSGTRDYERVSKIRMISNYLFFLHVNQNYMLPGLSQTSLYRITRENLDELWDKDSKHSHPKESMYTKLKELFCLHDESNFPKWNSRDELAKILDREQPKYSDNQPRLKYANEVAKKLVSIEKRYGSESVLELLLDVWVDFLVYAANRCSRESHAKKLSSGYELISILWLMKNYLQHGEYALKEIDEDPNESRKID